MWRLVDAAGLLSTLYPHAIGVEQETGRGYQIIERRSSELGSIDAAAARWGIGNAPLLDKMPEIYAHLRKCAATFSDFATTLTLLHHTIAAEAAKVAEDATRALLREIEGS